MNSIIKWSAVGAGVLAGIVALSTSAEAIVGGQDATAPYPAITSMSIVFPGLGTGHCGGTLIDRRLLLTAAHCVSDQASAPTPVAVAPTNITVRVGSSSRLTGGVVATGLRVALFPSWAWGQPTGKPVSDLALVELDRDIPGVAPLRIAQPIRPGQIARLVGWGLTVYPPAADTTIPIYLQQRDVVAQPVSACAGISAGELCVGNGACLGDSGSPALHHEATRAWVHQPQWSSAGIASRESSKQDPCGQPTIYTDPTYAPFRAWIGLAVLRHSLTISTVDPCICPPRTTLQPPNPGMMASLKLVTTAN